jgi:hypothetical protein
VAGEKEHEKEKSVREQGVPVNENLLLKLRIVGDELGIEGMKRISRRGAAVEFQTRGVTNAQSQGVNCHG